MDWISIQSLLCSLVVHAATAHVMESYIDEISARSGPLFEAYKEATGVDGHSYGKEGTRNSYRLFVIDKAIPVVYGEHEGATRDRVEADPKYGSKARTTIDHALKVGQVLYWLEQESKSTWSTPRQAPQAKTRWLPVLLTGGQPSGDCAGTFEGVRCP